MKRARAVRRNQHQRANGRRRAREPSSAHGVRKCEGSLPASILERPRGNHILSRPGGWRETALKWDTAVRQLVNRIIANPGRGHLRPDLQPEGVRANSVKDFEKYLLFYRWCEID